MGSWKGIKHNLRNNPDAPLELYDLENDVSEKNNVAEEYPKVTASVEKIMLEARSRPITKAFQFGRYRND
jgi:hypothetical protein